MGEDLRDEGEVGHPHPVGQDRKVAVPRREAGKGVALDELRDPVRVDPEIDPGEVPASQGAVDPQSVSLDPGDDPLYVLPSEPVTMRFASSARSHHVEITTIDSNEVLLQRELGTGPATVVIPWQGTFRWRVSARDKDGLEGLPSKEGLIAVVAK